MQEKKYYKYLFLIIVNLTFISAISNAQSHQLIIHGRVTNASGIGIPDVDLFVSRWNFKTETDSNGYYSIITKANYHNEVVIQFSKLDYIPLSKKISLSGKSDLSLDVHLLLKKNRTDLRNVKVIGHLPIEAVRKSAYNVVALDAKPYYNTSLDIAHILDKSSGVTIRENGGVGSSMSISLNGFTGKEIKLFMDGVPMEGYGSAFQLNNIPVGLSDRIEVYKGVVPIELGGDALGGAINVITRKNGRSYMDVSFSYGSFDTHKFSVDLGYHAKSGFFAQLNAFQNYSANNYKVYTQILNLSTGAYSADSQWVRRFHDHYRNETAVAKFGFRNKKWADQLTFGLTLGQEHADVQQAYIMRIVYGQKRRISSTIMPSVSYAKSNFLIKNLNFDFNASYNRNYNKNIDTSHREYNWLGQYITRSTQGEGSSTLAEYYNNNGSLNANFVYHPFRGQTLAFSNMYSHFSRKATDKALTYDDVSASDSMPKKQTKNVASVSYRIDLNRHLNATVFAKHYGMWVTGPVDTSLIEGHSAYKLEEKDYSVTGFGGAATYLFSDNWQAKVSYEKAYRMPTETELFGDGDLEVGDASIRAEHSNNYNLGLSFNTRFNKIHALYVDLSLMYRDVKDYIRRVVDDSRFGTASYTNQGKVDNKSINVEVRYVYKDLLSIGGNMTYQDLRNKQRYQTGTTILSSVYNDRMPNVPYFFGGTEETLWFHDFLGKGNLLSFSHDMQYIHQFFIDWSSLGTTDTKDYLPTQLSHDLFMSYTMKNGRYNFNFEVRNLTDRMLYDNFSLQKPGRSFTIRFRYFFMK